MNNKILEYINSFVKLNQDKCIEIIICDSVENIILYREKILEQYEQYIECNYSNKIISNYFRIYFFNDMNNRNIRYVYPKATFINHHCFRYCTIDLLSNLWCSSKIINNGIIYKYDEDYIKEITHLVQLIKEI
jgi:hypothetical protein